MHGQVGAAVFQGSFQFFDKQTLAADLRQAAVEYLIASRGHAQQRDLHAKTRL